MSRQSDLDNHANQLNPNNDEFWHSREDKDQAESGSDQEARKPAVQPQPGCEPGPNL